MGQVKFQLNNPHHVFLHDTPAKNLFDRSKRDLSHGCVRVQSALPLAALILQSDPQIADGSMQRALDADGPQVLRLSRPVPVHLVNVSAWVDPDGTVQFRGDGISVADENACTAQFNPGLGIN